jgi:hypothetical protein
LLAIIRDLRVVLILLARQLVRMRAAARLPEAERRELAQLSADIHAPLANRLGIWQLKWELEDLAFRFLQPDTYKRIAQLLDEKRGARESFIENAKRELREALARSRYPGGGCRAPQAHLQHLEEDAAQGRAVQRALRHPCGAGAGGRHRQLLRSAGHRAWLVDAGAERVR